MESKYLDSLFRAVIHQETLGPIEWSLLMLAVSLVSAAVGAFVGAYLKKRGEEYATRHDIDDILERLELTTKKTEEVKSEVLLSTSRLLEEMKSEIGEVQRQRTVEADYKRLQRPVVDGITKIIVRLEEILAERKHSGAYTHVWDPQSVSIGNKRDTTVYRILRWLGTLRIYEQQMGALPPHPCAGYFQFYIDKKIIPLFSTSKYGPQSILWRDMVAEAGEAFVHNSEKWETYQVLNWFEFVERLQAKTTAGAAMRHYAGQIAEMLMSSKLRLALLGIYLIDLKQDTTCSLRWEKTRNKFLQSCEKSSFTEFSIWGKTIDKKNDWQVMDIANGVVPRNIKSPHYDASSNPMRYEINRVSPAASQLEVTA
jgi:hypothetical protein